VDKAADKFLEFLGRAGVEHALGLGEVFLCPGACVFNGQRCRRAVRRPSRGPALTACTRPRVTLRARSRRYLSALSLSTRKMMWLAIPSATGAAVCWRQRFASPWFRLALPVRICCLGAERLLGLAWHFRCCRVACRV
jgi:hypothetical protein